MERAGVIGTAGQPVDLNPGRLGVLFRNVGRIQRLRQAIAAGDNRPELRAELTRRYAGAQQEN